MNNEIEKYKDILKKATKQINKLNSELKELRVTNEIAIIGYSCRFPGGANSPNEYWDLLAQGRNTATKIKKDRFDIDKYYSNVQGEEGKIFTQYASFLDIDITEFDNTHFEILPQEAKSIDPQFRLLLEVSWEALENSGIDIEELKGSKTGVFIGADSNEYVQAEIFTGDVNNITPYSLMGVSSHSAAGRLSYFYDLKGPAITENTGCSASLTALTLAVDSLKSGQCDLAIVGGSNLILSPAVFVGLSRFNALSSDGKCKTFDDKADGFGRGEGCGIVVLKRLEDAKRDNNTIEAIVKGAAIGQDGKSNGFYAPNGLAETRVIKQALKNAALLPDDVDYIEAHGTGTSLGDFIEAQAVCDAFKDRKQRIKIGAVKSNIGHLEAAAGMASLIKVLLAMKHKKLPKSLNVNTPNKNIDWSKIQVVDQLIDWDKKEGKRVAGINAFGISGSLAHVIIQEYEQDQEAEIDTLPQYLLTLSAKSKKALQESVRDIREYIARGDSNIRDICYSSNITKSNLKYKFALTGKTKEEIIEKLDEVLGDEMKFEFNSSENKTTTNKKVTFLFTGQGSIYKGIAKELYNHCKVFRDAFNVCSHKFKAYIGESITDIILTEDQEKLFRPTFSQPIIFSIEYALAKFWEALGIRPNIVIGHSIGEYAAACYGGILSLDNAIKMIAQRGQLMEAVEINGSMISILTDVESVKSVIKESGCKGVSIAAINAPKNVTISGKIEEVNKVIDLIRQKERVFINKLNIPHPYHSILMKDYESKYDEKVGNIEFQKESIKIIPCMGNQGDNSSQMRSKQYWVEHLSNTVKFQEAIKKAEALGTDIFIEIGGDATLTGLASQCITNDSTQFLPSMRNGIGDFNQLFNTLSTLFLTGLRIDFGSFYKTYSKSKVFLPNYPFQRKRFWSEVVKEHSSVKMEKEEIQEVQSEKGGVKMEKMGPTEKTIVQIKNELKEIINMVTGLHEDELEDNTNLFSLGFDSLMLMTFNKQLTHRYNINIAMNTFFTSLDTVEKIAGYIHENGDIVSSKIIEEEVQGEVEKGPVYHQDIVKMPGTSNISSSDKNIDYELLQSIFNNQFKIMAEQNEIIKAITNGNGIISSKKELSVCPRKEVCAPATKPTYYVPYKKLSLKETSVIEELQLKYIKDIEERYTGLTKQSKANIQDYRNVYANNRNVAGFRPLLKEMLYQIVAEGGQGSKVYDLDGNEFIDLTMGFGVSLFGHNPKFVNEALEEELSHGMPLGPMGRLAGEVASQISELTGMERVAFYNSGTEANMVAVRIARAITGRNKIVVFSGSYHGTYDGLLGLASYSTDGTLSTIPLAPGITENAVKDLVILNYNSDQSLKYIQEHKGEIAAVLVESVQSRRPDLRPKEFLVALRKLTVENDIALIFDEIITGFRIGAGGAQEYYGIEADIATYGKVAGGGMPIGIVAGKSKYMDSIDGGMWQFGDDSVPPCDEKRTFVAGTFSHHPMAMASCHAILKYIKQNRDSIYTNLNRKTDNFVKRLNEFFMNENVPISVVNFGSLFRFVLNGDFEIFFYGMLAKGIYIWEGRNCFLSTAHSNEDIDKIIAAVKLTIQEMRQAGYFGEAKEFPQSSIQERLNSQIMITGEDPFDMVSVFMIEGKLDIDKVEKVINQVIERHEILRTCMFLEDGKFKQRILERWNFKVKRIGYRGDLEFNDLVVQSLTKFDLSKAPLIEVILIEMNDNKRALVFHTHHTVMDGISMDILAQEFIALYSGMSLGPVKKQYRDFVEWERNTLTSQRIEEERVFWSEYLADTSKNINIPYDFPKTTYISEAGNTVIDLIDSEHVTALKQIARNNGTSLYMVLLTTLNILLSKVSRQNQIAITTPAANRFEGGFEECLGMFTNTVILSNEVRSDESFSTLLQEVKRNCAEVYKHLYYPFNLLVKDIKAQGENPFNIAFVYENVNGRMLELNGLRIEEYQYIPKKEESEITFELLEKNEKIEVFLRYRVDLFKSETMERLLSRLLSIIEQITQNPQVQISKIDILTNIDKTLIMEEFNNTNIAFSKKKTVVELFEEQVEKTPERIAVEFNGTQLTYEAFNNHVNSVAHQLREMGVAPEDRVVIMAEHSIFLLEGIYGIIKAGGAYIPIDLSYPDERIQYILEDSKPKAMLVFLDDAKAMDKVKRLMKDRSISVIDLSQERAYSISNPSRVNKAEDLLYCIYTSGTTGQPKGVMIEHRNLVNYLSYGKAHYIGKNNIMPLFSNCAFDLTVTTIFLPLVTGGKIVIYNGEIDDQLRKIFNNEEIGTIKLTPGHLKIVEMLPNKKALSNFEHFILGGEALNVELCQKLVEEYGENIKIHNEYGPTECTIGCCDHIYDSDYDNGINVSIGKPISNTQIYILNDMRLCGIDIPGEICVAGNGVARGYLNKAELTKEKFIDNPFGQGKLYRTGDLGRWLADGTLEYMGRIDEQVKIRGYRIELGEIERRIRDISGIQNTAVIARKDSKMGDKVLLAYVVSNQVMDMVEIKHKLKESLPEYMIPNYMMQIDKIPVTRNGKLDKDALPEIEINQQREYVAPSNEIEETFCEIFRQVLDVEQVGITDNFYELGGDSIKAIRIVSKLREVGYNINYKEIMQKLSIGQMVNVVTKMQENQYIQEEVNGPIMRTPILESFEEWHLSKPNHFNHAVMLKIDLTDEVELRKVFDALVKHHDILRAVYRDKELVVLSHEVSRLYDFQVFNWTNEEELKEKIENKCNEIQASIDLTDGPLMKLALFNTKEGSYMMICIHHIVIDGISWRILLEDFQTAVEQVKNNQDITLPKKTASYQEWAEALNEYRESRILASERPYWHKALENAFPTSLRLVEDVKGEGYGKLSITLSKEETNNLIYKSNKAFNTEINDLLISAIGMTIKQLTGQEKVAINLEGHGREEIHKVIDTDRTVGWFTSIYPVVINCCKEMQEEIICTKEVLREIPNNGIGYGLLKHELPIIEPDICFNYFGEMDSEYKFNNEKMYSVGKMVADENKMPGKITMDGMILNDSLNFEVEYDKSKYTEGFMQGFVDIYKEHLLGIINLCTNTERAIRTKSDYGSRNLQQSEFDEIMDLFN